MADLVKRLRRHGGNGFAIGTEAADEIERLQRIIDSRPAINAGLPQTYIDWSRGVYECDVVQAKGATDA